MVERLARTIPGAAVVVLSLLLALSGGDPVPAGSPVRPLPETVPGRASPPPAAPVLPAFAALSPAPVPAAAPVLRRVRIPLRGSPARSGAPAEVARALLAEHRGRLGLDRMPGELRVVRDAGGPAGHLLRLTQVVNGVPVFGSDVTVRVAPDGRPLSVRARVYPVEGLAASPATGPDAAVAAAREYLMDGEPDPGGFSSEEPVLVAFPRGRTGVLAWRVDCRKPTRSEAVFVEAATGEPVATIDLRRCVDALVFDPNPCYGATPTELSRLTDTSDADSTTLTDALVPVTLGRLDATGRLRGQWAEVLSSTGVVEESPVDYTRSEDPFEQVMVYYHLDRVQQLLQDLGITNANDRRQVADAHGLTADNSYYDLGSKRIYYGDGGVDDAEDGDTIVHEYGHAIQDNQIPLFGLTDEGGAMGEGFGDFLAVAMHAPVFGPYGPYDPLFACWDATGFTRGRKRDPVTQAYYLRRTDTDKVYPDDIVLEVHDDGEIWSRLLFDLMGLLGRDEALRLIVVSQGDLDMYSGFSEAADAILDTNDAWRPDGTWDPEIRALLDDRGIPHSPAKPPEGDDDFEPNDSSNSATPDFPVNTTVSGLILRDDDFYRITVPPNGRLQVMATFPRSLNLDLEALTEDGTVIAASRGIEGTEQLELSAGPYDTGNPPTWMPIHLRVFDSGGGSPGVYSLTLTEAPLRSLTPGETSLIGQEEIGYMAFAFPVSGEIVSGRKNVKIQCLRSGSYGAVNSLRVTAPGGGAEWFGFGDGVGPKGAKLKFVPDMAGNWTVEVLTRPDPAYGPAKIKLAPRR
jgi:hypothetical protein